MDVPTCERAKQLAEELGDAVTFYKIGLELMMSGEYFELLDWMLARDKKVFCDLKFFDIPATVGSAVRSLKDRGATFVTVHGNRSIMEAAADHGLRIALLLHQQGQILLMQNVLWQQIVEQSLGSGVLLLEFDPLCFDFLIERAKARACCVYIVGELAQFVMVGN